MPRPRRLLRFPAIAPDGRRYVVEEVPRGRCPQVRVWDPTARRYQRLTLTVSLRDADHRPNRLMIREALRSAEEIVMNQLNPSQSVPTMWELFTYATDEKTAPARRPGSQQGKEWERAQREAQAIIPEMLTVEQFDARHLTLVSLSAMLRTAVKLEIPDWGKAIHMARHAVAAGDIDAAMSALHAAYTHRCALKGKGAAGSADTIATAASRWPVLCAQLLRAMCNHAAQKLPRRFAPVMNLRMEKDQTEQLARSRREQNITEPPARPNRPRYPQATCLAMLRLLTDPRYDMQALLASVCSSEGAYRIKRSHLRIKDGLIEVGIDVGGTKRVAMNWRPLGADVSAAVMERLGTVYAEFEAKYFGSGVDYHFLVGHVWDGAHLIRHDGGRLPFVDPRYRLMQWLGVERRAEQMLDCWRRHVVVIDEEGHLGLDERTNGTKTAALQMLTASQERALGFELRFGYLADAERDYRAALVAASKRRAQGLPPLAPPDYPLFPSHRLANGRAKITPESKPANDRTLSDWNRGLEKALGLIHEPGLALRGWRRGFADLYDRWTHDASLLDRVMDHTKPVKTERGSTRSRVYLNAADLRILQAMAAIMEYARVDYPRTGVPRRPDA